MNTNQSMKNGTGEDYLPIYENPLPGAETERPKDTPIIHEAEIITPQPYGVFALCKILEHFQIN